MHKCDLPVDCYGEHGRWSPCSADCGDGNTTRIFSVITPAAFGGSNDTCNVTDMSVETISSSTECTQAHSMAAAC